MKLSVVIPMYNSCNNNDSMKRLDTCNIVNIYHVDNPNSLTQRWSRGEIPVRKSDKQQ